MSKIIIDTNILYSLVGISPNSKLQNFDDNSYSLAISTPSLIEVIVKFRNDLDKMQRCLMPVYEENIELIFVNHIILPSKTIKSICTAKSLTDITHILDTILTQKIQKETELLYFCLVIVVSGVMRTLIETDYGFDSQEKSVRQVDLMKDLIENNEEFLNTKIRDSLEQGYKIGNEAKSVQNCFQFMLSCLLTVFNRHYHIIKLDIENTKDNSSQELKESLNTDNFDSKLTKYEKNPVELIRNARNSQKIDEFYSLVDESLSNKNSLNLYSVKYILAKIEKIFNAGALLKKNDVFDFLIIFSLDLENYRFITLDMAFAKCLKNIDIDSYELCQELGFIN